MANKRPAYVPIKKVKIPGTGRIQAGPTMPIVVTLPYDSRGQRIADEPRTPLLDADPNDYAAQAIGAYGFAPRSGPEPDGLGAFLASMSNGVPPPAPAPAPTIMDYLNNTFNGGGPDPNMNARATPTSASARAQVDAPRAHEQRAQIPPIYEPEYKQRPVRPQTKKVAAPPVRDTEKKSAARNNAQRLAQIVPLLSLITGGEGYTQALGRAPGQAAKGINAAQGTMDDFFDEAMQRYGIERQNTQYENEDSLGAWLAEVQGVQGANQIETAKANQSIAARNAAVQAQGRADALAQRTAEAQQRRVDEQAERDEKRADAAAKVTAAAEAKQKELRITRVRAAQKVAQRMYNHPRATPATRARAVAQLEQLARDAPDIVSRFGFGADGLLKFTAQQQVQNKNSAENLRLRQEANQRAATRPKRPTVDPEKRVRTTRLNAEVNDLQQMINNPRTSAALKQRAIARLQYITTQTGIGPRVKIEPSDISDMTPGQRATADRAASKGYNDKAKKVKIISVEEIQE